MNAADLAAQLELELLKSAEIPLAAAINGVKGSAVILNRRRNWKSAGSNPTSMRAIMTIM